MVCCRGVVLLFLVACAVAVPIRGSQRSDGQVTISEAFSRGEYTGIDDWATYHPAWFNEAPVNSPATATGYFLADAAKTDGAVCLDGTPSAYFHRPGTGSGANKWYIHQQGGGWCESISSCYSRALTDLGSSKAYPKTAELSGGYFDISPTVNPQMYNWNSVFMRYCDGNSFSGSNDTTTPYRNLTLHFRGKLILDAQISSLLADRGLQHATDVVVSGCSAGGLATFLHCDHWATRIHEVSPAAKVRCMPDSGFFLDYEGPPHYHSGMTWAFYQQNSSSGVNANCIAAHPGDEASMCMFAEHTAPFIETPTFPLQSAYDSWQLDNDLASKDVAVINAWGKNLTDLVKANLLVHDQHGIFLDSCLHHCGMWGSISIDNQTQAVAFEEWYTKGSPQLPNKGFYNQDKPYLCTACCHV